VSLHVEPGDTTLISGEDLVVTAEADRQLGEGAQLLFEFDGEPVSEQRAMSHAGDGATVYRGVVKDVRSPLRYAVAAGGIESPWFAVGVIERPYVTGITLEYAFPRYSGLLPRTVDENNGDITALRGTRVEITVGASKALERAELVFESGDRQALSRVAPTTFRTTLTVRENTTYAINIVDVDGLTSPDPPGYAVVAVRDEYPLVRIAEPGEDRDVPRGMVFPVLISAIDDYGISRLDIRYSIEGIAEEGVVTLEDFGAGGEREVVSEAQWDLSETGILPGSVLVYFAEVTDSDDVTGPKTARSESYLIRFPSMAELYDDIVGDQDDIASALDELVDDQMSVRDELNEIRDDLRSEPEIDWQDEERVEAVLDRQEEIVDEVTETAERMSDLSDRMAEADRIALETMEKTEELVNLLDEVATDEMRELLEEVRRAMDKLSPERVTEAMENMTLTQDDYLKRLEQTLNLLKRIKAEQQLADVTDRAGQLADRERQLAEEADQSPDAAACSSLAQEQAALRDEAEKLRSDLEKAIEDMKRLDAEAAGQMSSAASEMDRAQTIEKMEKARANLLEQKGSEAAAQCSDAANDLKALFTELSSCTGGSACRLRERDRASVMRAIYDLLAVSREQEEILEAVDGRSRIPREEIVELAAKQADLAETMPTVAERMFRVSKDSFIIDPSFYRAVGMVQQVMTRAASSIAEGGAAAGASETREALGQLNALVINLLTANQRSSSASGGSALERLMQQLRQMSEEQSELTELAQKLKRQREEMGMSSSLERQLAEMKARQELLEKEARRLAEEFSDRREILGRLDDMADEMSDVIAEMERSGASQETIDRQKRILSRLLDAQRSLRRRDYVKERRSRTGRAYARGTPGAVPDGLTRATQELREDLLRAMQRDYPLEYRELIRAYFEALTSDITAEEGAGTP
jgi:hypothetical protein